tara:strand:+ start:12 stop:182 length:171 start_codon:yes stop_codon:yes gene_type:complete
MKIKNAIRRSRANSEWYAQNNEEDKSGQKLSFTKEQEQDTLITSNNNEVKNGNNKS